MILDCTAIAYNWVLAPADERNFDVALILARCRTKFNSEAKRGELEQIWEAASAHEYTYHAQLPRRAMSLGLADVSGVLGLLWPASDKLADQKAAAFERLVADTIQWLLAEETFDDSSRHIVLLQGPLIPKLRGRLLYRGISPSIPIYILTYQAEWFKRIEAAQSTFDFLPPVDKKVPVIGSLYPPRGIDCSTRSWVCASARKDPVHFEIIANTWNCCQEPEWLSKREEDLKILLDDKILYETDKAVHLPGPLGKATEKVRSVRRREQEFLRLVRFFRNLHDIDPTRLKTLAKNFPPFVSKEFQTEGNNVIPGEFIEFRKAASFQATTFDEEKAYQWYKENHQNGVISKQVKEILRRVDDSQALNE